METRSAVLGNSMEIIKYLNSHAFVPIRDFNVVNPMVGTRDINPIGAAEVATTDGEVV